MWCKVTKYIYSSIVFTYNFWGTCTYISTLCSFILLLNYIYLILSFTHNFADFMLHQSQSIRFFWINLFYLQLNWIKQQQRKTDSINRKMNHSYSVHCIILVYNFPLTTVQDDFTRSPKILLTHCMNKISRGRKT